jgi:hypothetical protein
MKLITILQRLVLAGCAVTVMYAQQGKDTRQTGSPKLRSLPRQLEIDLALSAAPPHLRSEATLYLLDTTKGYVLERKGSNGFTCYVQRTDYVREDFRDDYIVPECQDPEGSRTIAPVEFEIEKLRAEGKLSPSDLSGRSIADSRPGFTTHRRALASLICSLPSPGSIAGQDRNKRS